MIKIVETCIMKRKIYNRMLQWKQTKDGAGITKNFFDEYFDNRETAYAYKLGKIKVYDQKKELKEYGLKAAPQSFVYI